VDKTAHNDMKYVFGIGFIVLLCLSLVASATRTPPAGGKERTTLVWATDNNPVREAQVELFNKLNPDLKLVIDPMNAAREKVIVQSIGGVGPDLFDSFGYESLRAFVNSGVAWDITEALKKEGIVVEDMIWPVGISSCVKEGKAYGFPANISADAVWFNKDIFDKEGVPYPKDGWTWDDLIATAKKLTKRNDRGQPIRFGVYFSFDSWAGVVRSHGGRVWNEDGTECLVGSPEATAGFQVLNDLMYKHKVAPSPQDEATLSTQGGWGSGGMTYLMDGRVAMAYGGRWWLNLIRRDAPDLKLGVVEMPYAKVKTLLGGARCVLVNSKSPRREAAIRFIKYLASKEYNQLLNDQADALAPVKAYCEGPRFMLNPKYPRETYNHVWRAAVEKATPEEVLPSISKLIS
jgi:multiple sugar transport system substrate-binding protein